MNTKPVSRNIPFLLFLIIPFAAMVEAIRNYKAYNAKNLVWLFIIFYGYTFVISNENMDASRYQNDLVFFSQQYSTDLASFLPLLYHDDTRYVDILQPLLTFLISRFTDNGKILFAVFGVIFGYFYSRNLWFLFSAVREKIRGEAFLFLVLFAMTVPIWHINGFRFWTATHVFVYGLFLVVNRSNIKGFLICVSSLLVHFSFILPVLVLVVYLMMGNRLVVCFALYFISFFISQVTPETVKTYATSLPGVVQERANNYTNEDYIKARAKAPEKANWYIKWRVTVMIYAINVLLAILFFKYRRFISMNPVAANLLCISLLLFSVTNLLIGIPSLARFQTVSFMVLFASLFLFVQNYTGQKVFKNWAWVPFVIVATLYIVVEIRRGFDSLGVMTIIGNPFVAPFVEGDIPIIDLIK